MSKTSDEPFRRIEVITSVQRRRRWSVTEKVRLVEEPVQPVMSVSFVARQAGISAFQLFAWKRRMLEGGHAAVQADEDIVGAPQVRELEKRVRDLERMRMVVLRIIGVFVPLVPKTAFFILAASFFERSSRCAQAWLFDQPKFGPPIVA